MRDIKNFEGLYAVTSCGKVWSYRAQKFLKPYDNGQGYLSVCLWKGSKRKTCKIHMLVAQAYLVNEDPEHLTDVSHKDNIKTHNYIGNLEYATHRDNIKNSVRRGHKRVVDSILCVELNTIYPNQAEAARALNIHRQCIVNVLAGKQKTAGGYHFERVKKTA